MCGIELKAYVLSSEPEILGVTAQNGWGTGQMGKLGNIVEFVRNSSEYHINIVQYHTEIKT